MPCFKNFVAGMFQSVTMLQSKHRARSKIMFWAKLIGQKADFDLDYCASSFATFCKVVLACRQLDIE